MWHETTPGPDAAIAFVTGRRRRGMVFSVSGLSPSLRFPTRALPFALAIALAACGEVEMANQAGEAESESFRLGRVHVIVEEVQEIGDAEVDEDRSEGALEVSARFALVRGLSESFARARATIPELADQRLALEQCGLDDPQASAQHPSGDSRADELEELVLVNAGDIDLQLADEHIEVPLTLVPDLLPYMSGVEYSYRSSITAPGENALVVVEAEGSAAEQLSPFTVAGELPGVLGLDVGELDLTRLHEQDLELMWQSAGAESVILRLTAHRDGEIQGHSIACVLPDSGATRFGLDELRRFLPERADRLDVSLARISRSAFDAGAFESSELIVERRASVTLGDPM